ncbi:MAG: hypothetical protein NTX29_11570 [Actinobacteria bacterium]|nr:hypothetical protein [Actinomycetota bacterium]
MSYQEKNQWVFGAVTVLSFAVYALIILSRAQDVPLVQVAYAWPMVWTVIAAILANIILMIIVSIATRDRGQKDERDQEINRRGEQIGMSMVVVGSVGALIMSMLELEYFWIANVIYVCFVLSAILGTVAKLVAYRRGFVGW